jgi:hypothetical protein
MAAKEENSAILTALALITEGGLSLTTHRVNYLSRKASLA